LALEESIAGQEPGALPATKATTTNQSGTREALAPVQPIVYSGPLTMSLRTYTPEVWQPRSIEQKFERDYDRYYRRPMTAYPCRWWACGGPFYYWGPYVFW
jgi:hypothetical protein